MKTTENELRMPLIDNEFVFNLPSPIWSGGDDKWSNEMSLHARNGLNSLPYVEGSVAYEAELYAYLWRDKDRSAGDRVRMVIATQTYMRAHREERQGAIAVTLGFGSARSAYDVADSLKTTDVMRDLQQVLELVLRQGRLEVIC